MTVHDELHRLVLRSRWIKWADRDFYARGCKTTKRAMRRMRMLSSRLSGWRPTWRERRAMADCFDGAVP